MNWIDVNDKKVRNTNDENENSRALTLDEIHFIEQICNEDVQIQKFATIQELKLGFKKRELLLGTMYHELGHLKKAMELNFHFDYLRIGKRVFFVRDGDLFTVKLKQLSNPLLTGCTATHIPGSETVTKEKFQAVALAGTQAMEQVFDQGIFSKRFEKIKRLQHPTPNDPYSKGFKYVANEYANSDEWLWWHLELESKVAPTLNNIYQTIGTYFETEKAVYLESLGALDVEKANLINALKLFKENEHRHTVNEISVWPEMGIKDS